MADFTRCSGIFHSRFYTSKCQIGIILAIFTIFFTISAVIYTCFKKLLQRILQKIKTKVEKLTTEEQEVKDLRQD